MKINKLYSNEFWKLTSHKSFNFERYKHKKNYKYKFYSKNTKNNSNQNNEKKEVEFLGKTWDKFVIVSEKWSNIKNNSLSYSPNKQNELESPYYTSKNNESKFIKI